MLAAPRPPAVTRAQKILKHKRDNQCRASVRIHEINRKWNADAARSKPARIGNTKTRMTSFCSREFALLYAPKERKRSKILQAGAG
jgi:hypothetical protein